MKKFIMSIIVMLCFGFNANAELGVNVGVTALYGVFEAEGASEKFTGAHSSGASPGDVEKKASTEGDSAEGEFALASIFIEKTLSDRFAIGLDYVPVSADSDTTENVQTTFNTTHGAALTSVTNTVQVDFEDLTTFYAMINLTDNVYAKAGIMTVDVVTNETLASGGAYGNTDLDGTMLAIGYSRNLDNGAFVRLEGSYMDFEGATLTNTNDSTKSVKVDGIEGYGARLSIGKSF